jgi:hypothetical protein
MAITVRQADAILNDHQGVAEAAGLYGPFTATINTGERPQSHTKTKRFKREDDAILWAEDWLENAPQYVFATAEVTDPDGNVVWTTDESLEEVSLDLAKRARDKAEHMVDMDYDDMRDKPYGHSEKQRIKFQRYIDKKEPRAKGDRDWSPPEQGVAESEYDPSYDPEYRGYQKPEQDPDAWKQARDLAQPNQSHSTVIVYDATRKEVLRFPSTGGYYGDVKYALSKGYNTESDDYDIKWQRDVSEDQGMTDIADWKQAVLKAYPRYADHIKFKGRGTQVSAEVPGMDRSFGVFDLGTGRGEVLDEGKIYLEKLTNALAEAVRKL